MPFPEPNAEHLSFEYPFRPYCTVGLNQPTESEAGREPAREILRRRRRENLGGAARRRNCGAAHSSEPHVINERHHQRPESDRDIGGQSTTRGPRNPSFDGRSTTVLNDGGVLIQLQNQTIQETTADMFDPRNQSGERSRLLVETFTCNSATKQGFISGYDHRLLTRLSFRMRSRRVFGEAFISLDPQSVWQQRNL